jgi:hypothetical protein
MARIGTSHNQLAVGCRYAAIGFVDPYAGLAAISYTANLHKALRPYGQRQPDQEIDFGIDVPLHFAVRRGLSIMNRNGRGDVS